MTTIKVNEFLETAFDMEDAEILKEKIMPYLESNEPVLLDFKGVEHFTSLFFSIGLCDIMYDLGQEKYDKLVILLNLPDYAKNSYKACYQDIANDPFKDLNKYEIKELSNRLFDVD